MKHIWLLVLLCGFSNSSVLAQKEPLNIEIPNPQSNNSTILVLYRDEHYACRVGEAPNLIIRDDSFRVQETIYLLERQRHDWRSLEARAYLLVIQQNQKWKKGIGGKLTVTLDAGSKLFVKVVPNCRSTFSWKKDFLPSLFLTILTFGLVIPDHSETDFSLIQMDENHAITEIQTTKRSQPQIITYH